MYSKKNKSTEEIKKELPQDVMIEIALRLPVKSIGRFRCVSKERNLFLLSPEFIKSHFQSAPDHHESIILINESSRTLQVITQVTGGCAVKNRRFKGKEIIELLGSCNGLVLLQVVKKSNSKSSFVLMNPVTSRATRVPASDIPELDGKTIVSVGLGYNSVDDDYKMSLMIYFSKGSPLLINLYVFSFKTRTWKKHADSRLHLSSNQKGVYADGRLHLPANMNHSDTEKYAILAFDFSTEKFEKVPLPTSLDQAEFTNYRFAVIGGCLALTNCCFSSDHVSPFDTWIMEKPGYWKKFTIDNYPSNEGRFSDMYDVVCRLGEFEFVLVKNNKKMVAYNCETEVWRDLNINGLPQSLYPRRRDKLLTFKESFDCPKSHV